jgi:hypothetical protein
MGEARQRELVHRMFTHGDGNEKRTIRGDYELFTGMVLLRPVPVQLKTDSAIVVIGEEGQEQTRYLVVGVGDGVDHIAKGDLVMVTGRVVKVIKQDLLAQYVTPLFVDGAAHIIVPADECVARVS